MTLTHQYKTIIQAINKLFLLTAITFPFLAGAQNNLAKNKTFAIVIGISQYQNTSIPVLSYADKDARLFADWLQNNKANNLSEDNLKLFLNEDATIANIYASFNWLKEQVSENDEVYLYFSGHGDIETDQQFSKGYLLAWNSPSNNYINNAIAVADLNELANSLTTINKAKVILITDACHSGKMAGDFYKGRELTANNLRLVLNNQVRLAACRADELAAEGPGWGGGRGVFSYYLLRGLEGFAKGANSNKIRVEDLAVYLDSSFKKDEGLKIERHIQHPVIDGSPLFSLAVFDSASYLAAKNKQTFVQQPGKIENTGLKSLKSLGEQPIDYFFSIANKADLDTMLDYKNYLNLSSTEIPLKIVNDYLEKLENLKTSFEEVLREDPHHFTNQMGTQINQRDAEKIRALQNQLSTNKYLVSRFNENLVQLVHKKCQEMINAYLSGDLIELEKRQYYNTGKKPYANFLSLIQVAINSTPEDNYLSRILKINKHYLAGLEQRMQMAISKNGSDSLLQKAFAEQEQALELEPYAAYIHNELGNLYIDTKNYDSALYHYNYASALAPTWAIPYSNKIRLYFATQKPKEAYKAAIIANSLQPNLTFVHVNVGLVMEKDSNWLAAEDAYLNAIAQNSIHYLPYERLGFVYLNTGEYAKSNTYFKEADARKISYAVNDKVFETGIMGNSFTSFHTLPIEPICRSKDEEQIRGWESFVKLGNILPLPEAGENLGPEKIKELSSLFETSPELPFAAHFLGKEYFRLNHKKAEIVLRQAIRNQIPEDQLNQTLIAQLKKSLGNSLSDDEKDSLTYNSCILKNLLHFQYDHLEDYYMLANIYEKNKKLPEAIKLYKKVNELENERLLDQANFKGYVELKYPDNQNDIHKYEVPVKMGSSLKMADIYEQLGKYDSAEIALLDQVRKNRLAGFARQAQIDKGNIGTSRSGENLFWLRANEDLEAATYNFYSHMLAKFPRDAAWYKNAGVFLYERLALTYNQIPLKDQKDFYTYSLTIPYPFNSRENDLQPLPENPIKTRSSSTTTFELPITHEKINIEIKVYDPLTSAINFMQQAIKYSGELKPEPKLLLNLAHLNGWMGNSEEAINHFQNYLAQKPQDTLVRNQFINYLHFLHKYVAESNQLSVLNSSNDLNNEQVLKLAGYKVLSNEPGEAKQLLARFTPKNSEDKNVLTNWRIHLFIMEKNYTKAISLLNDSLTFKVNKVEQEGMKPAEQLPKNEKEYNSVYTQVRLYALLNQNKTAMLLIEKALNAGFKYGEVLKNDPLLKNIRKKKSWDRLLSKFEFSQDYLPVPDPGRKIWEISSEYRIPKKE